MVMSGGEDGRSIEWDEGERDIITNSKGVTIKGLQVIVKKYATAKAKVCACTYRVVRYLMKQKYKIVKAR